MSPAPPGSVCIRADAGLAIGAGHVARCRSLAAVLANAGIQVCWACRQSVLIDRLIPGVHLQLPGQVSFEILPSEEATTLGCWAARASWLVIDHYGCDESYIEAVRSMAGEQLRILLLDDHQQRGGADLRLAPAQQPCDQRDLCGLEFCLLHPAFADAAHTPHDWNDGYLICLGGSDPIGLTRRAIEQLPASDDHQITVILEDQLAEMQGIDRLLAQRFPRGRRLSWQSPEAMARHFRTHAVAIVSASGLAIEALAMGCTIVALHWANNHERFAEALGRRGIVIIKDIAQLGFALSRLDTGTPVHGIDAFGAWRVAHRMGLVTEAPCN